MNGEEFANKIVTFYYLMLSFFVFQALSCPIPSRPPGIVYNPDAKDIIVEMYADPLCSDCLDSWSAVSAAITKYKDNARFIIHLLPLPYHTWTFMVSKVIMAAKSINTSYAPILLNCLYADGNQSMFLGSEVKSVTAGDMQKKALKWAAEKLGITVNDLTKAFGTQEMNTRIEFKYSAVHNIDGTPTFYINGVASDLSSDSTIDDWSNVIDPLLN